MEPTRKSDLKKARTLQILNVIYDAIEVIVALIAGIIANSSALIGWALDSTIEVLSATTLGWRLHGELKGIDKKQVNRRKKITLYVIAVSFTLVCIFISYDSVTKLLSQQTSSWSTMGLIILVTSLLINPILIHFKRATYISINAHVNQVFLVSFQMSTVTWRSSGSNGLDYARHTCFFLFVVHVLG